MVQHFVFDSIAGRKTGCVGLEVRIAGSSYCVVCKKVAHKRRQKMCFIFFQTPAPLCCCGQCCCLKGYSMKSSSTSFLLLLLFELLISLMLLLCWILKVLIISQSLSTVKVNQIVAKAMRNCELFAVCGEEEQLCSVVFDDFLCCYFEVGGFAVRLCWYK